MATIELVQGAPPNAAQGACYLCRCAPETFVRTQIDIAFEGELAICESCGREIAEAVGYVSPDNVAATKEANEKLTAENEALRARNDALEVLQKAVDAVNQTAPVEDEHFGSGTDYEDWRKDALIAEAESRNLDSSGTRADIIARLRGSG